jgi:hypothetical protein
VGVSPGRQGLRIFCIVCLDEHSQPQLPRLDARLVPVPQQHRPPHRTGREVALYLVIDDTAKLIALVTLHGASVPVSLSNAGRMGAGSGAREMRQTAGVA